MNVSLVGDVEDEFIFWCGENLVHRNAEFDDAEVGAEVTAGDGKAVDECTAYFFAESDELFVGKYFYIRG
jgi:hypothetical protein